MSSPPYELPMTGRLPHFRHNWTLISPPNNVLDYIEGLTLPLTSEPIPTINQPLSLPKEHIGFIRQEISRLLSINAIQRTQETRLHQPGILAEESIWSMETNTKSQAPKQMPLSSTLQDGGNPMRLSCHKVDRSYMTKID